MGPVNAGKHEEHDADDCSADGDDDFVGHRILPLERRPAGDLPDFARLVEPDSEGVRVRPLEGAGRDYGTLIGRRMRMSASAAPLRGGSLSRGISSSGQTSRMICCPSRPA